MTPGTAQKRKDVPLQPALTRRKKADEQNHLIVAFALHPAGQSDRFAMLLLSAMLGGGCPPRLFQEVRRSAGCAIRCTATAPAMRTPADFAVYTALNQEMEEALRTIVKR